MGLENYIANAVSGVKGAGPSAFGLDGLSAQKRAKEPGIVKTPKTAPDPKRLSPKNVPVTKRVSPPKDSAIAVPALCSQAVELLNKIKRYECAVQSPTEEETFQGSPEASGHDTESEETSETPAAEGNWPVG